MVVGGATQPGEALVVGEALVDVVSRPDGSVTEHPGGSPANVALGLARLGRPTNLLTSVGDDERGGLVRQHLEHDDVRLVEGSVVAGPTSVARAALDADGSARYTFDLRWDLPDVELPPHPLVLHTGSVATVLQPGAATVERVVLGARRRTTVTYDPNVRPDLVGPGPEVRPQVEALVAACHVVKLSEEDAAHLAPGTPVEELAQQWLSLGPSLVVVTLGADGALGLCRAGQVRVDGARVTVADTVGAGDSFMAGLVDGLWSADLLGGDRLEALASIRTDTLHDVVQHAIRVSAVTVSRPGADPPRRADLV